MDEVGNTNTSEQAVADSITQENPFAQKEDRAD
jgi:hypothetical protein